jgi:predicted nucleotidyltransferase
MHLYKKEDPENFKVILGLNEAYAVYYHSIFDYPLKLKELVKWRVGRKANLNSFNQKLASYRGYFFLQGKENSIYKRLIRESFSKGKLKLAKKAAGKLEKIPTIKFIGVTGALAMKNADEGSDIDLLIITRKNTLWLTRGITLLLLKLLNIPVRRFGQKEEKNKLCLNIWIDESDLEWEKKRRNIFTAHEIVQITPLVDKENVFERFVYKNRWIRNYWPKAIRIRAKSQKTRKAAGSWSLIFNLLEPIARNLQLLYMRGKVTKEIVTPTKALFHPNDLSEYVLKRLNLDRTIGG